MALTPGRAAMGPGNIYVADYGTAEPQENATGIMTTPSASWVDCGGTLGGVTVSFGPKYKNLEFDQVTMPVGARKTEDSVIVKVKLAEVTLGNLDLIMSGGTLTNGTGFDKLAPEVALTGTSEPEYKALIIDGSGPLGYRRRIILRKALNTNNISIEYNKDNQQVFEAEFTGFYVSPTTDAYVFLQDTLSS